MIVLHKRIQLLIKFYKMTVLRFVIMDILKKNMFLKQFLTDKDILSSLDQSDPQLIQVIQVHF